MVGGSLTVPQIAGATGLASWDVLRFVATLKKYGMVAEGAKAGSYFEYVLTGGDASEGEGA